MKKQQVAGCLGVLFLLSLLGAEALVRVRAHWKYGRYLDIYDIYETHPEADILVPKAGLSVFMAKKAQIDIDSRGFRNPEFEVPKPGGTVRLAFLGGSTSFCGEATSNETTWPNLLVNSLGEDHGEVDFDYLNAGVTGYAVADSILSLEHRVAAMDPDVVVIYHAAKDFADDTRALAIEAGIMEERHHSWLEDVSLLYMLIQKNRWYLASQEAGRTEGNKLEYDPVGVSAGFRERLTKLVRDAQEHAEVVALCTFAIKTRRDQDEATQLENLSQSFTFTPYLSPEGILDGFEAYNQVVREVAAETGAVLVGDEDGIPGTSEYFSDSVHFTEAGYAANAVRAQAALEESEAFQALLLEVVQGSGK